MRERLEFYLRDVRGFAYDVVKAVLAAGSDDVVDAIARAEAVSEVRGSEDFTSISVAFKRIKNILRQAAEGKKAIAEQLDPPALTEESEKLLAAKIPQTATAVRRLREEKNYAGALAQISQLRQPVDAFFDKVMVMVDDEHVRANRLALLRDLLLRVLHHRRLQRNRDRRQIGCFGSYQGTSLDVPRVGDKDLGFSPCPAAFRG